MMMAIYLTKSEAIGKIRSCASQGIGILGVDRMVLKGGVLHPDLSNIADYSSISRNADFVARSVESALEFICLFKDGSDDLFDVVPG
jgi:hypothetical protein